MNSIKRRKGIRPIQILPLGFLFIIVVGTLLLMLPMSTHSGHIDLFDAVFTATSASCVTGLSTVDTGTYFTTFGKVIVLLLIQVGGLGFMTMTTFLFLVMRRKVSLRSRVILKEALGENTPVSAHQLMRHAVVYTLSIEGVGMLFLATRFIPKFGLGRGLWFSLFHSISAFCNAGFDLMGAEGSLQAYVGDPIVNITVMLLIILGGLGFAVIHNMVTYRTSHRLGLQTKLVLWMSLGLILGGWLLFFVFEYSNPATLGPLSVGDKLWASLFQSVTCRTAGFFTVNQAALRDVSKLTACLLMFIGAAPAGTAGGVKVTTILVILLTIRALIQGNDEVEVYHRTIVRSSIRRALCLIIFAILIMLVAVMSISMAEGSSMIDIFYEVCSALGTVGLTSGVTAAVGLFSKAVLCVLMYFGRVGLLTLVASLGKEESSRVVHYPSSDIMIG